MEISRKTADILADRGDTTVPHPRCTYVTPESQVRCCRDLGHDGPHHYRCCAEDCPGYPWLASQHRHPCTR